MNRTRAGQKEKIHASAKSIGRQGLQVRVSDIERAIRRERKQKEKLGEGPPPSPGDGGLKAGDSPQRYDTRANESIENGVPLTSFQTRVRDSAARTGGGKGTGGKLIHRGALASNNFSQPTSSAPSMTAASAIGGFMGTVGGLFEEAAAAVKKAGGMEFREGEDTAGVTESMSHEIKGAHRSDVLS